MANIFALEVGANHKTNPIEQFFDTYHIHEASEKISQKNLPNIIWLFLPTYLEILQKWTFTSIFRFPVSKDASILW